MTSFLRLLSLVIFCIGLGGCAPDSREEPVGIATTHAPREPEVVDEDGYKIARGATRLGDVVVRFDPATKSMILRGKLEYLSTKNQAIATVQMDLTGLLDNQGFIALKGHQSDVKSVQNSEPRVVAKATCLSDAGTCHSSFIDIYLYSEGVVYHHQIESHQDEQEKPQDPITAADPEESEGGADEIDGEPGRYVGTIKEDIEKLLEVKPKLVPSKEEPKHIQAIGPVNGGRLENAKNVLKFQQSHKPAGFAIIRPQRLTHFSTSEMEYIVGLMGQFTKTEVPGNILSVGDLSREGGGPLGAHKSHQNGLDVDVAFYFDNKNFQGYFASAIAVDKPHANWMVEAQWKLFKSVVNTKLVDRIFIHRTLKKSLCDLALKNGEIAKDQPDSLAYQTLRRLIADTAHNNHFHLRVKCSSAQARCRQMAEPAPGSGCF